MTFKKKKYTYINLKTVIARRFVWPISAIDRLRVVINAQLMAFVRTIPFEYTREKKSDARANVDLSVFYDALDWPPF